MGAFTKVAEARDLRPGEALCVDFGGETVAVFQVGGSLYAIGDTCTHVGGPLSEGRVEGTTVTCPWHGAQFDLATGRSISPPASGPVSCYRVRIEGGEVQLAAGE